MKTIHTAVTFLPIGGRNGNHTFATQHAIQRANRTNVPAPAVFNDQ